MKKYLLILMIGLLAGCSEPENEDAKYWSYGFASPPYYRMQIEHARSIMANNDELELMTGVGLVVIDPMMVKAMTWILVIN